MRWLDKNNLVVDEFGNLVCTFPDDADGGYKQLILSTPKLFEAVQEYMLSIESGSYPGKKAYNRFKTIMDSIDYES